MIAQNFYVFAHTAAADRREDGRPPGWIRTAIALIRDRKILHVVGPAEVGDKITVEA